MNNQAFLLGILVLIALTTYLFVEAPAPLPDGLPRGKTVPVAVALAITQAENALVRALYTQEIGWCPSIACMAANAASTRIWPIVGSSAASVG
jgi:hypothetical protein